MQYQPLTASILSELLDERVNVAQLYAQHDIVLNAENLCPFHEITADKHVPTLRVLSTGRYSCTECEVSGDTYIDFYQALHDFTLEKACSTLYHQHIRPVLEEEQEKLIVTQHQALLDDPNLLSQVIDTLGISRRLIEALQIGYCFEDQHTYVPIYDRYGQLIDMRHCALFKSAKRHALTFIPWHETTSENILYPDVAAMSQSGPLHLVGTIRDALVAQDRNIRAVTPINGVETWSKNFKSSFVQQDVVIIYPVNHAPSYKAAIQRRRTLYSVVASLKLVAPGITYAQGGLYHYFHLDQRTTQQFEELVDSTATYQTTDIRRDAPLIGDATVVTLQEATHDDYYHKPIVIKALVSGKTAQTFLVPKKIQIQCTGTASKRCALCHVVNKGEQTADGKYEYVFEILPHTKVFSSLVGASQRQQNTLLRETANIPTNCTATFEILSTQNVELLTLIPDSLYTGQHEPHTARLGYYVGHGILPNRVYQLYGHIAVEARHSQAVIIITKATPVTDSLEDFHIDGQVKKDLALFQPVDINSVDSIAEKLTDIYTELSLHCTHIYNREDLHLAMDLVWHTPITFYFNEQLVPRGWLDVLILGDSRVGKTWVAKGLINYYQLGDMAIGDACSYAGLIGGLVQIANHWIASWGKFVINNHKLIVMEETSSIKAIDIEKMSNVRSEGVASIHKIHKEDAAAQTRKVWLANPRQTALNRYSYGIDAIVQLIGKHEDIARFDYAFMLARGEVSEEIIGQAASLLTKPTYTAELCRNLILWIWTRRPQQVTFTKEATNYILTTATQELTEKYVPEVPLVQLEDIRLKLARMAMAIAGRLYSTDDTYERIIVTKACAEYANKALQRFYDRPAMDYLGYSEAQRFQNDVTDCDVARKVLVKMCGIHLSNTIKSMVYHNHMTCYRIADWCGQIPQYAQILAGTLVRCRIFTHTAKSGYRKTPAGATFLRSLLRDTEWIKENEHEYKGGSATGFTTT